MGRDTCTIIRPIIQSLWTLLNKLKSRLYAPLLPDSTGRSSAPRFAHATPHRLDVCRHVAPCTARAPALAMYIREPRGKQTKLECLWADRGPHATLDWEVRMRSPLPRHPHRTNVAPCTAHAQQSNSIGLGTMQPCQPVLGGPSQLGPPSRSLGALFGITKVEILRLIMNSDTKLWISLSLYTGVNLVGQPGCSAGRGGWGSLPPPLCQLAVCQGPAAA